MEVASLFTYCLYQHYQNGPTAKVLMSLPKSSYTPTLVFLKDPDSINSHLFGQTYPLASLKPIYKLMRKLGALASVYSNINTGLQMQLSHPLLWAVGPPQ